jgi:RNA polymerase sigma-70 factor (ECF subfamily)
MWPDPAQTQHLLNDARHGDAAAVDQLLDQHRAPLRRAIALRLDPALGQRVDASDIVQEVILEASQRINNYLANPVMPFHLWLRQMAQDHIIDAHRKHRVAQRRSLDREQPLVAAGLGDRSSIELAAQLMDPERTPASAAIQHELQRRVETALAQLGADDREVILMRHFEQLANQEVAAALGLTEAAAAMRYLRALRRLRALLDPGGPPQEEPGHE